MKEGGGCGVSKEVCVGCQNIYRTKYRGSTMKKREEVGGCGGRVDGERKDDIRTKNEKRKNSRNLKRKEIERGVGAVGGGWRKMRGNAVKELPKLM